MRIQYKDHTKRTYNSLLPGDAFRIPKSDDVFLAIQKVEHHNAVSLKSGALFYIEDWVEIEPIIAEVTITQ